MTHFLNHCTLKFTPLSPLHIGADESYEPGNYVIDDDAGALYSFDSSAALAGLSEGERQQLLAIVNSRPDDTMLTKVQAFFYRHRKQLLAFANTPVPTVNGIKTLYEKRIGKTAQHEGHGNRVINKLEIDRTFYNPVDGRPLLPGSSIKGAIRTALLDRLNDKKPLIDRHERNQQLQQRLFDGKFHTDPMRLFSIGDARWQGNDDKPACQIRFAVNRKRKPVMKDGTLLQSRAEAGPPQLLECVLPKQYQSFIGSMSLLDTQSLKQDDYKLPKQSRHWTIKDIAKACNTFYIGLFWQELKAMKDRNYLDNEWRQKMEELLGGALLKRLNDGDAFLLRLGRHSGAEALTLNGVRNIKIIKGGGEKPTWEKQPKTWWFAASDIANKQGLLPFGWVLVEIDPQTPNTQLQQYMENSNAELSEWMHQQLIKQNELKQQTELRQKQEQARRQAEKEQVEQARLQQEAEKQRRASMTPEQLQTEALRQQFEKKQANNVREQIGGQLYGDLRSLIQQAADWPNETRLELLAVAKNIVQYIGAADNKKAKELLRSLQ